MAAGTPHGRKVRIEPNIRSKLPASDVERLIEIALVYFPDYGETSGIVKHHLECADSVRIVRDDNDLIVGYAIASSSRRLTPFYPRPVNLVYQRMLYLDPGLLKKGLGKRLLCAVLSDLLGPFWPFRRFAVVCRTQNPVVARMMDMHSVSYPRYNEPLPEDVRKFAESLLPMLLATGMDAQCRLLGTLDEFRGVDYTDIWNRHLHKRNNGYEKLMLSTAFTKTNGRIINNGMLVLMVAYSKPFRFIRFLFH